MGKLFRKIGFFIARKMGWVDECLCTMAADLKTMQQSDIRTCEVVDGGVQQSSTISIALYTANFSMSICIDHQYPSPLSTPVCICCYTQAPAAAFCLVRRQCTIFLFLFEKLVLSELFSKDVECDPNFDSSLSPERLLRSYISDCVVD